MKFASPTGEQEGIIHTKPQQKQTKHKHLYLDNEDSLLYATNVVVLSWPTF